MIHSCSQFLLRVLLHGDVRRFNERKKSGSFKKVVVFGATIALQHWLAGSRRGMGPKFSSSRCGCSLRHSADRPLVGQQRARGLCCSGLSLSVGVVVMGWLARSFDELRSAYDVTCCCCCCYWVVSPVQRPAAMFNLG